MKRGQFNRTFPDHHDFGAHRKPYGVSSFNRLVRQYKANAKRREMEFDLTDEQMRNLTSGICAYCGAPPSCVMKSDDSHGEYVYNGIDRMDPAVGYVVDNCATCCTVCNRAKGTMTLEAWVLWLQRVCTNQNEEKHA